MFSRRRVDSLMAAPSGNLDNWANGTWLNGWMVVNTQRRETTRSRTPIGPLSRAINRGNVTTRTRTRADQPTVRVNVAANTARALAAAASPESQRQAMEQLHRDVYAATSQAPQAALLRRWERFHLAWFCGCTEPFPLSVSSLKAVSSMFRAGNYSSIKNYIFAAKGHHIRLGHPWNLQLDKTLKDCIRSVNRGLGVSNRSEPIDLEKALEVTMKWRMKTMRACLSTLQPCSWLPAHSCAERSKWLVHWTSNSMYTKKEKPAACVCRQPRKTRTPEGSRGL